MCIGMQGRVGPTDCTLVRPSVDPNMLFTLKSRDNLKLYNPLPFASNTVEGQVHSSNNKQRLQQILCQVSLNSCRLFHCETLQSEKSTALDPIRQINRIITRVYTWFPHDKRLDHSGATPIISTSSSPR